MPSGPNRFSGPWGGLSSLEAVGQELAVSDNDALTTLEGLDSLATVGVGSSRGLRVAEKDLLVSTAGLEALTTIDGGLVIASKDALTGLAGFVGLTSLRSVLNVHDNATLATCEAEALRDQLLALGFSGEVRIHDNDDAGVYGRCEMRSSAASLAI